MGKFFVRLFALLLLATASVIPAFATATVTATFVGPNTQPLPFAYITLDLNYCGFNVPSVPTIPASIVQKHIVLRQSDLPATIYGNDEITCGNSYSTLWHVTAWSDQQTPLVGDLNYQILAGSTFNLATAQPFSLGPGTPPPPGFGLIFSNPTQNQKIMQPAGTTFSWKGPGTVDFSGITVTGLTATGANATQIQGFAVCTTAPANGQALIWSTPLLCYTPGAAGGSGNATSIQGVAVNSTAPMAGQFLGYNGSQYIPTTVTGFLPLTGGTMTGAITLAADPVSALQAATKQYVDNGLAAKASLVMGLVPTAQLGTGIASSSTALVGNQSWRALANVAFSGNYSDLNGPLVFQTNSINNAGQTGLNLIAGSNITLTPTGGNAVSISASGGGGGGGYNLIKNNGTAVTQRSILNFPQGMWCYDTVVGGLSTTSCATPGTEPNATSGSIRFQAGQNLYWNVSSDTGSASQQIAQLAPYLRRINSSGLGLPTTSDPFVDFRTCMNELLTGATGGVCDETEKTGTQTTGAGGSSVLTITQNDIQINLDSVQLALVAGADIFISGNNFHLKCTAATFINGASVIPSPWINVSGSNTIIENCSITGNGGQCIGGSGTYQLINSPLTNCTASGPAQPLSSQGGFLIGTAAGGSSNVAPLASPALTGTPTAPTPATGDSSTTVATTAFVKAQNYSTFPTFQQCGFVTAASSSTVTATTAVLDVSTCSGADAFAKYNSCTAALPSGGGVCDGHNLPAANTVTTNFAANKANVKYIWPAGAFTLGSTTMSVTVSGVEFEGVYGQTIINATTPTGAGTLLTVGASSSTIQNVAIRKMTFNGNRLASGDTGSGMICVATTTAGVSSGFIFEDNFVNNCGGAGLNLTNSDTYTIRNNTFTQNSAQALQQNANANGPYPGLKQIINNKFYDNDTANTQYAVNLISFGHFAWTQNILYSGNILENDVVGGDHLGTDMACTGNNTSAATGCHGMQITPSATDWEIANNTVQNVASECYSVGGLGGHAHHNKAYLCNVNSSGTVINNGSGGFLVFFKTTGAPAGTPSLLGKIEINDNRICDAGYGISINLGNGQAVDTLVVDGLNFHDNQGYYCQSVLTDGLRILNASGSTACGGGSPRQCQWTIQNSSFGNNYWITNGAGNAPLSFDAVGLTFNNAIFGTQGYVGTGPGSNGVLATLPFETQGGLSLGEMVAPSGEAGFDLIYGDSTNHWPSVNANNAGAEPLMGFNQTGTPTTNHLLCVDNLSGAVGVDGKDCGIAKANVVTGAATLTSTAIVTGGGTEAVQTPSATSTLNSSGNMALAGTLSIGGLATSYNGTSTVGVGLTPVYAVSNKLGQTGNLSTQTLAVPSSGGSFLATYYLDQSGLCGSGSGTVNITLNWTDGSNARSFTPGTALTLGTTQSVAAGYIGGTVPAFATSSTNISYTTTLTTGTCSGGAVSYDVHVSVVQTQ
jgi:hypothetical protein